MTNKSFEDTLLEHFLTDIGLGKTVATKMRYTRTLTRLQFFLDQVDVAPYLGTDPAAILEVERDFGRRGAFLRIFGATELVCCLPEFLDERWLPSQPGYARTQISLVGRLLRWLKYHRLIDMSVGACAFWEAEAAVKQARGAQDAAQTRSPDRRSHPWRHSDVGANPSTTCGHCTQGQTRSSGTGG